MQIERITNADDWSSLADAWDCMSRRVPFRGYSWLSSWWQCYGQRGELYLLVVRDDRRHVVAIAPLWRDLGIVEGRALRLLGDGEVCSDYVSLLAVPEFESSGVELIADWLVEQAGSPEHGWNFLDLNGVSADDLLLERLTRRLEQQGCLVHRHPLENTWRTALPASFDEYLAQHSKDRRKQLRRMERDYFASGRAVQRLVASADELPDAMAHLARLHQLRRTSLGEQGCFASARFAEFLPQVARRLLADETLQLVLLELDGTIVAAEFAMVGNGVTYLYQGGFDPAQADHSPGQLNLLGLFRRACELQHHTFDFLRGDEPYKARWRAVPVRCDRVRIAANRTSARLRDKLLTTGTLAKSWLKTSLATVGLH